MIYLFLVSKVGDFVVKKQASFEDITLTPEIELEYSSSSEEEEVEEEEVEEENEEKSGNEPRTPGTSGR